MNNELQPITPALDLCAPSDRFESSSRLHGRLHRWNLLLRRFWWVTGLSLVLVLVPVFIFTAESPPAYQSKARMWLTGRLNIHENRLYTEELIDYLGTQGELLRSPAIQQRALTKLRTRFKEKLSPPSALSGLGMIREAKAFLTGLAGVSSNNTNADEVFPFALKVTEASKNSILELRATGTEPESTRAFLNLLMDEYFTFKKENRQQASQRTVASVGGEVRQLAAELKAQQDKLHAFQTSNNVVFLQEQGTSAAGYLALLNRQLANARTQLKLLQSFEPEHWIDAEGRRGTVSGEPADSSARDTLVSLAGPQTDLFRANQQSQLLKAKRDELSRVLQPLHPKIIKLNEDIATQEKLAQISRDEAVRQLANRRRALQLEIKNLEAAFAEWDIKAIESSGKMADYDRMRQDLQRLQAAYDRLLGVIQTVDVGRTMDQDNVGILEPASAARALPRLARNMGLALFAALALSFAALYFLGMLDDRFASVTELSNFISEPVIGQIPAIALKHPKGQLGIPFLERQRFEFLESFRNLRSAILFMSNGQVRPKTILLTSSVPKEGKSTVALYLAATMALGRSRVLLIDGDMRRPSLDKYFGAKPRPGLAEILSREVAPALAITPSNIENLSVLCAGVAKRNPGELVLSPEWNRFISELYPQYDYILIDSPPLLATDDAASLAPKVDGVLMIVRGSFTSARMTRRALDLLRLRQARVLGIVFNRAVSSAYDYHHYQHYRNTYQWRPKPSKEAPALIAAAPSHTSDSHAA